MHKIKDFMLVIHISRTLIVRLEHDTILAVA